MNFAISGNAVAISGINAAAINAAISVVNLVHNSQIRREQADCRSAMWREPSFLSISPASSIQQRSD